MASHAELTAISTFAQGTSDQGHSRHFGVWQEGRDASSIIRGMRRAKLPETFDCTVAAQIIVTYLQGFYRVVRVLHDHRQMEQQRETLLRGLGLYAAIQSLAGHCRQVKEPDNPSFWGVCGLLCPN
jgi:hypothetical protein